ncbi:MAG: hypothetical protein M1813_007245 [Trichoglossum hirsutum]|nr:MAG: hypothetical protein M1813_007245 [Trichoglossum hirsutum]
MDHIDELASTAEIFFILGGPGAGKGTQCTRLAQDLSLVHISVGDLLRTEKENGQSETGELIDMHMRGGTMVPTKITMAILKAAIGRHVESGTRRFLVDGFPRHMEQALAFEKETSGRVDDNELTFNKRMKGFWEETMPVIEYFQTKDKLIVINCDGPLDEGYFTIKQKIEVFPSSWSR